MPSEPIAWAREFIEALDSETDCQRAYLLAIQGARPKMMQGLAGHYSSQISMGNHTYATMGTKRETVAAVSEVA